MPPPARFGYPMKPRIPPTLGSTGGAGGAGKNSVDNIADEADAKRPRKSQMRRTVDYNSSFLKMLERRVWQRDFRDKRSLQPDILHYPDLLPPQDFLENTANTATTKFVKTATNKMRCPIFTLDWTPEGRRLITGASSGEFTLWNGLTFNFETILQAHDSPVRTMKWSHNDNWMITGDHTGYIKYWQSNMNNVKMFQAHKEPVRSVSFAPTDLKFASCSDDGTVRIWDFYSCSEERVLRGHGSDVRCVDWHPTKGLIASGSKDNQQPVKIWEPKSGAVLTTLHAHKNTVMCVQWNKNGNWLLTASRDHLIKLFDIRNTKEELQTFRGHKKEASTVAWHPIHESAFASGGSDGSIMFWNVGSDKEMGVIEQAHESIVWALAWHPVGHILCSGSNDHSCKFWTRNRPGDTMRDKYNLNTLPSSLGVEDENTSVDVGSMSNIISSGGVHIPGMSSEDRVDTSASRTTYIPGLDDNIKNDSSYDNHDSHGKKQRTPYSKPIPKSFQASWNDSSLSVMPSASHHDQSLASDHDLDSISLQELQRQATAVVAFGNVYPVLSGSSLSMAILSGELAVKNVLRREFLDFS